MTTSGSSISSSSERTVNESVASAPAVAIAPLDPERDEAAAAIVASATGEGTVERGRAVVSEARGDPDAAVYGLTVGGELAAVYVLRKVSLMNEIACLAVAEGQRRQGHGRACLYDALLRSGRRPLVVETDDETVGFYKACGFKLVGKRKRPDGVVRYRLGWHAPLPQASKARPDEP
jgi:ribosomal protein S18 acetylase RimI-like enzyme